MSALNGVHCRDGATIASPCSIQSPGPNVTDALGLGLHPVLVVVAERLAPLVTERLLPLLTAATAPSLVGVEVAAKLIDVPTSWLAAEARRGTFRSYKRGHYRRYDPLEVVEDFKRLARGDQ